MKKVATLVCGCAVLGLLASGCSTVNTNKTNGPIKVHLVSEWEPQIEAKSEQVKGGATVHTLFGIFSWGTSSYVDTFNFGNGVGSSFFMGGADKAKSAALFDACSKSSADILIAPYYTVKATDYFVYSKVNCEVKGYPGVVKGIKPAGKK